MTSSLLAVGACVAVLGASGCEGDIGESRGTPTSNGPNQGIGGANKPVGAPGEIDGVGGATGNAGTGGTVATGTGGTSALDAGAAGAAGGGTDGGTAAPTGDMVHGLSIADVAIYQAVKVSLIKDGQPVTMPDAPLVRNRPALLRVFVTPAAGWQARSVVARLQWGSGPPRDVTGPVAGASADGTMTTTLNFNLTAADLTPQVQWSVTLYEAPGAAGTGTVMGARMPADGTPAALNTTDGGPSLKIQLVPIQVGNVLPDTSAAQIKFLTDAMYATYPVVKIDATVRDPITAPGTISAQGSGWDSALNQVCMTRQNDHPARNVFYYGLINPAASFQTYCAGGCVEGIAVLATNPNQDFMRCAMGIGYTNMGSGVFLQEVAHSMGRSHAPCGNPAQPDKMYPYAMGRIGVWGYDMVRQRLIDPTRTVDFMSYCSPVWISDYTFAHLLPWIQAVNLLAPQPAISVDGTTPELASARTAGVSALRFPPARWRVATVESDGRVLWGPLVDFDQIEGETHTVEVRDAANQASTVTGLFVPHSATGGGMLLLPATTPLGTRIQIGVGTAFRDLRR